nr:MAG TPA: hypothetical protein [Caudoviricetes sp.]
MRYPCPYDDTDGVAVEVHGGSQSPLRHRSHTLRVDSTMPRPSTLDTPRRRRPAREERTGRKWTTR